MDYLYVVRIGSDVVNNSNELEKFLDRFAALKANKVLVHGGGRIADELMTKMGIRPKYIEGRRVMDAQTLNIVNLVYNGLNKELVAKLFQRGNNAFGLSGVDGCFVEAQKQELALTNYGLTGDIEHIRNGILQVLLGNDMVPVVSPLALNPTTGEILNVNSDTFASALASAMARLYRTHLIFSFGLAGVFKKFSKEMGLRMSHPVTPLNKENVESVPSELRSELLQVLSWEKFENMLQEQEVKGGMITKLESGFEALQNGVAEVHVCHSSQIASNGKVCEGTELRLLPSEEDEE